MSEVPSAEWLVAMQTKINRLRQEREAACGAWGGCPLPAGHNRGRADIPENHEGPAVSASEKIMSLMRGPDAGNSRYYSMREAIAEHRAEVLREAAAIARSFPDPLPFVPGFIGTDIADALEREAQAKPHG